MVCFSGVLLQGWDVGTLGNTLSGCVTQYPRVDASEASAIHPTHTNVCVCGTWTHVVCVDKAQFPSSPHSVVSRVRLSPGEVRVWPARLHAWHSCSDVKLTFYLH